MRAFFIFIPANMATIPTRTRTGIIFRPGDYGAVTCAKDLQDGKRGIYTDADLDLLATDTPIPIKPAHTTNSPLTGKLGQCSRAYVGFDERGQRVLMGEWEEPEPLAQLLGDMPRRVSVEIDPLNKRLMAVALVTDPAIPDAAMFEQAVQEAYATFEAGQQVVQFGYIPQAERDKIPAEDFGDPERRLFPIRNQQDLEDAMHLLGKAHDPAAVRRRIMEIAKRKGLKMPESMTANMGAPLVPETLTVTDATAGFSQEANMTVAQEGAAPAAQDTQDKGFMERLRDWFMGQPEMQAAAPTQAAANFSDPEKDALKAQLAQFEADRSAALKARAEAEADALVASGKIAAKGNQDYLNCVAAFSAAYSVPEAQVATFGADEKPGEPVSFVLADHLKALYGKLPALKLDGEATGDLNPAAAAMFEQPKTTATDPKDGKPLDVDALLAATETGRKALAAKAAQNGAAAK